MYNLWQLALRNGREKKYSKNNSKKMIKIKEISKNPYDLIRANSMVIRQKGESQKECYKETKQLKFSKKRTFLTCVCVSVGEKSLFSGKFGVLCFLVTLLLRFALLPYYRRTCVGL